MLLFIVTKEGWEPCPMKVWQVDLLDFVKECSANDVSISTLTDDGKPHLTWDRGMLSLQGGV